MNVGDTAKLIATFSSPGQEDVIEGSEGRVCTVNDYDGIASIDLGDRFPVVPIKLLEITKKKISTNNASEPQTSNTGSIRYNKNKPQMSLLYPEFLLGIANVMTRGLEKYDRSNWQKGNNLSIPFDSLQRHILSFWSGESIDKESGEHHLLHAAANLMMMYYYEKNYPGMDDRDFK